MDLVIISGRSGSGKTVALRVLEDLGYYCIDNLPVIFLPELVAVAKNRYPKLAVSIDIRNMPDNIQSFEDMYKTLRENKKIKTTLIYVDAEESVLIKRYSETRRLHPLSKRKLSLDEAIVLEGSILEDIASLADLRIDTSSLSIHDLAAQITTLINGHPEKKLVIVFESFGFKNGIAKDADFIFDARFLPNPFWDPSLRSKTGLDIEVVKFFDKYPQVNLYINQIDEMLTGWLGDIEKSNRSYLTVAIGCTGGCHRSVFIAQSLYERFEKRGLLTKVRHRSLEALKAGDKKS
ncbi:RNase adapter RapZ [Succinatimonas hippei]|uniref:RNase adapter RapZ n=1 Tax=Succinatimonas hippei TaxID=626938 RepID=UPI0023F78B1C|nr:RNase adapter RapZ [Succinatimonas hippei]MDM8119985.1 RNase adapter RapZ [Succinatimonas hippei]